MGPRIVKPNLAERQWIAHNLAATQQLTSDLNSTTNSIELVALDSAYSTWFAQHDPATEDPNPIINAFGIAFGQHLVDHLKLTWVVASDEHGTELAVHGQPGDILVYPANLVAKRYTARETGFFVPLFDQMKATIPVVRSSSSQRSWWKFW